MTFDDILDQAIAILQRRGRVTYRTLKRQFALDDGALDDLKFELVEGQRLATDENGTVLVWTGKTEERPVSVSPPAQTSQPPTVQVTTPTDEPPLASRSPEAERRQLTVMFCDLVDSTTLSSQLDPEDYREVIREYQKACSEVIQRYDGHIAQYLGDGLLVYFGYPVAHEEDAQRAIHTGLGIIQTIQTRNARLEQEKSIRLAVRLGIHTGLVVVGEMGGEGRHEQLALGEVPNVAARIQGIAEADTLLISSSTYRLIEGYFDCQALGERVLRGVADPLGVYRVMQESGAQSRLDVATTQGLTPLVGRESEVTLLLERWEQVKAGQGQVVLLSGEAGIGKSRLVEVLKDAVTHEPHALCECRCSPYFQHTWLYPLIELLERTLAFDRRDSPDAKLQKLEGFLRHYHLDLKATVPLFALPLSLALPETRYPLLTLTPQRQKQLTLEAILALFLELATHQPLLFILEDLHWTDPTTLELLSLLIDHTPAASLFLLLTCRPTFQPSWHHRSYLTEMTVNPLSRDQIARVIVHVAGGKHLPEHVLEQISEKTDGVPLFIEEITKAVLESGVLKERDGQYDLDGSVSSLSIPTTLHDSLMARLDRLVTAKGVAQQAAVIGRQFSYPLLQAVSALDDTVLQRELGLLVETELLYQRGAPPHATYIFKHALIQDTAYESLLRSTRQGYHRRIAEVMAERFPETVTRQPELLAHHYTQAGLHEHAVAYWHQAGRRAVEYSAHREAIEHYKKALEVLKTLPETPEHVQHELDLQIALGPALMATKGYASPEVESAYARARELCQQMGETPELFRVLRGLWAFYAIRGPLQLALDLGTQLLSLAQRAHDPALTLEAHAALGFAHFYTGAFVSARTHLAQARALYDPDRHRTHALLYGHDSGVTCRCWTAMTLWLLGYPDEALVWSHEALTLAHELSHPFSRALGGYLVARFHGLRRNVRAVQEQAEGLLTLCREQGFVQFLAGGTILRGWTLAMEGQETEGLRQMRQGLSAYQSTGATNCLTYFLALLAEVYAQAGRVAEGLHKLAEALALVDHIGESFVAAEIHRLKGDLLLKQTIPDKHQAESCFQQAIVIAQTQHAKSWELRAATSLATLWKQQGKRQDAYDLLAPVYNWFTEGFDTADLQDAKALLHELGE